MWRSDDTTSAPEACRSWEGLQRERLDLLFARTPVVLAANLVNGTLIAHGEVVVVNEKFGIRMTDVISPSERIKKLR